MAARLVENLQAAVYCRTQKCKFLGQEVRENRGQFIPLTARLRPRRPRDFHAQNSNYYSKMYTTEYVFYQR